MSKKDLARVAGGYEQIAFDFSEFEQTAKTFSRPSVRYIEQALKNLNIPLLVDSMFSGAGLA